VTDRATIYGRVSTGSQAESLETQLTRLRAAAPGAMEFVDSGISGRGVDRPAFDHLLAEVRAGRVGSVTVTKLDRLGRSARAILEFFNEADAHGARVVALDQAIDTSTPVGRLVRTVLAAMAELEADLIAERTREAMAAFKAGTRRTKSGRPIGRPRRVFPETEERIRQLRAQGFKWREIAVRVGIPTGTVKKVRPRDTLGVENPHRDFGTLTGGS
jgi:DNA invertase Pin-like site-specific DNA recombinase